MSSQRTIRSLFDSGMSCVSLTRQCLETAQQTQKTVNAYTFIDVEGAMKTARLCDERRANNSRKLLLLDGVPLCVKDAFVTVDGMATTAGSAMLEEYRSHTLEATAVSRLREAGAVIIGKTNLDEFCMGSSTTHSVHGPTINPHGEGLIAGGSSGGTAAAVACGSAVAGLGTDTGGSVRQPAAMCGVVGFKPSYGAISRWGVVAMASSLDTVGIIARNVADVALVFDAIRGPDEHDSTTAPKSAIDSYSGNGRAVAAAAAVVGMSRDFFPEEMSADVAECWFQVARNLGWDGSTTIAMPHARAALPSYYVISSAEASSNLARYDGVRYGFRDGAASSSVAEMMQRSRGQSLGPNTIKRILMGSFVLSRESYDSFFVQAQRVRRLVLQDFERAFNECDFLLVPTVASSRIPTIEEIQRSETPIEEWCGDLLTVSASLAGLPAISVPVGKPPLALQIIGPRFSDLKVLQIAERIEKLVRLPE